jgi:hypothetical protein
MSTPQQFLLCLDELHAEVVDAWIMESLRDRDNSRASRWSGVYTDGTRYGVLWAAPASDLFGDPFDPATGQGDPALVIATEVLAADGLSDWAEVVPEPQTPLAFP